MNNKDLINSYNDLGYISKIKIISENEALNHRMILEKTEKKNWKFTLQV